MAAKKKEKLSDYIKVKVDGIDIPVVVPRAMYEKDPEGWATEVRRAATDAETADKQRQMDAETEAQTRRMTRGESAEEASEPTQNAEEEARENDPNFDPTQFNMDGTRKTPEQNAAVLRGADTTVAETRPASKLREEDPDYFFGLSQGSTAALGSPAALENFRKSGVVTEDEAGILGKMNALDRADFLLKRMGNRERKAADETIARTRRQSPEELAQDAEELGISKEEAETRARKLDEKRRGTPEEGSGGGTIGSKIRSFFGGMATNALPGGVEGPTDETPLMRGGEVPEPLKLTSEPPDTSVQPDTPPPAGGQPTLGNYLTAAKDVMMEAAPAPWLAKQAGGLFPQALPPAGGPSPATSTAPPAPGQVPVHGAPGTPAPGAPQSVSASVKTATPGAVPRAPSDGVLQTIADAEALRKGAYEQAKSAAKELSDVESERLSNQKALQEKAMTDQQHIAEQRAAAEAAYSKSLSDGQAAMASLMAERRQLLTQRVDPDRYWNQAGAGRKVASVLAGALFGWAGQGMDYLQYLRGLVNDDIKLQQDELRRKGDTMDALVGDQKNIIALAKDKGMTDLEAVEAAKAARYAELKAQLEVLITESGIKQVKPTLTNMLAGLAKEQATAMENAGKSRQQKAVQDAQIAQGWARVNQEKRELAFRMHQAAQKEAEKKQRVAPGIALQLMNAQKLIGALERMKELAGGENSKGLSRAFWRKNMERLTDDEHAKKEEYDKLKFSIAKYAAESALGAKEQDYLLPLSGDERSGYFDPSVRIEQGLKSAYANYERLLKTAQMAEGGDFAGLGGAAAAGAEQYQPIPGETERE